MATRTIQHDGKLMHRAACLRELLEATPGTRPEKHLAPGRQSPLGGRGQAKLHRANTCKVGCPTLRDFYDAEESYITQVPEPRGCYTTSGSTSAVKAQSAYSTEAFAESLNEYFDETFVADSNAINDLAANYATDAGRLQQQLAAIIAAPSKFLDVEKLKAEKELLALGSSLASFLQSRLFSPQRSYWILGLGVGHFFPAKWVKF